MPYRACSTWRDPWRKDCEEVIAVFIYLKEEFEFLLEIIIHEKGDYYNHFLSAYLVREILDKELTLLGIYNTVGHLILSISNALFDIRI